VQHLSAMPFVPEMGLLNVHFHPSNHQKPGTHKHYHSVVKRLATTSSLEFPQVPTQGMERGLSVRQLLFHTRNHAPAKPTRAIAKKRAANACAHDLRRSAQA